MALTVLRRLAHARPVRTHAMSNLWITVSALAGYLLGALPFGYLVAKAHGVDIFKVGSGNPGATNVKRVLGPKAGNTVFALDAVKGAVATGWPLLLDTPHTIVLALIGVVAAVLGHSFSVFTRFKGGKGVATAAGGLVVLMPAACLLAGAVWVVTFFASRYVSLGSILAAAAIIVASWLPWFGYHVAVATIATVLAAFVIIRHHSNIRRLLSGTETKFVKGRSAPSEAAGAETKTTPHS
jgi:glycerol-3-phosphate acyltransferase PlsY